MNDDKSDKAGSWFGNTLPILMVVLLAAGVLVKNVPLESARPTDPERVKFVASSQQDVEARLWQDPFSAVAQHEKDPNQAVTPTANIPVMPFPQYIFKTPLPPHTPEVLRERIQELYKNGCNVTVIAVSVFGGSFGEEAESRRRTRFAVVSALDFHKYHPEDADALGYFHITLPQPNSVKLTVPFEWFETRDKSSKVLVLWLNENKLSTPTPLKELHTVLNKLTPLDPARGLRVKLIGPAGSKMLIDLIRENKAYRKNESIKLKSGSTLEVFSPNATISNCDLNRLEPLWNCFMNPPPLQLKDLTTLPIVRTTGTDDVLAAALVWELWQRGVNRDSLWEQIQAIFVKSQGKTRCADGLVLIRERDTEYGRTLSQYLTAGFSARCKDNQGGIHDTSHTDMQQVHTPLVRTFSYLRGLDGVLPDIDKSSSKASPKDDTDKSKDLRTQLKDAPPEHAEGRSQFDYLRRLADEIEHLDQKKQFAENGVKAIGIVGSDLYDKLLILQALRSRFTGKIFFTTDLDARYLHADQKDWARNLAIASNFDLSLRPKLQQSTLPFRNSYQTATYLATLMVLEKQPFDYWTNKMNKWLHPQIFEVGRTQAVHLASLSSLDGLTQWFNDPKSTGPFLQADDTKCDANWEECKNIEPDRSPRGLSFEHPWAICIMIGVGILFVYLASPSFQNMVRTAWSRPPLARTIIFLVIGGVVVGGSIILAFVWVLMNESLKQGVGEPFVWLEGVSVWPSHVVRSVCFVTMLVIGCKFLKMIREEEKRISKDFEITMPQILMLKRSWWSAALTGPYLKLALFNKEGEAEENSAVEKIEVATLWQNYMRATRFRAMAWWIALSLLIGIVLGYVAYQILDKPSFPHRGQLVEGLYYILVTLNALVLWPIIFWVGYEARACAQFIKTLSNVPNEGPEGLLVREAEKTGVPREHLNDYLNFQLIVRATKRIHQLIYLPFVSIFFMVLARSNFFDAIDFPLALFFVIGIALAYTLCSVHLLRQRAESARDTALERYETRLLTQARAKASPPPVLIARPAKDPVRLPISAEQIKILMERIRNTREGAFAPFAQQPALKALLLPFGGYGSVQLIEFLFKL